MVVHKRLVPVLLAVGVGVLLAAGLFTWRETLLLRQLVRQVESLETEIAGIDSESPEQLEGMRNRMIEAALATTDHRLVAQALLVAEKNLRKGEVDDSRRYSTLAVSAARSELRSAIQRSLLLAALMVLLGGMLGFVLRGNPESLLAAVISEVSRLNSGRVPVAISYYGDIAEDLELTLRYIKKLESKRWGEVRQFADEYAMPAVLENMNESFSELGPILDDINHFLSKVEHDPESLVNRSR